MPPTAQEFKNPKYNDHSHTLQVENPPTIQLFIPYSWETFSQDLTKVAVCHFHNLPYMLLPRSEGLIQFDDVGVIHGLHDNLRFTWVPDVRITHMKGETKAIPNQNFFDNLSMAYYSPFKRRKHRLSGCFEQKPGNNIYSLQRPPWLRASRSELVRNTQVFWVVTSALLAIHHALPLSPYWLQQAVLVLLDELQSLAEIGQRVSSFRCFVSFGCGIATIRM